MEFVNGFLINAPEFRQLPICISPITEAEVWQNKLLAQSKVSSVFDSFKNKQAVLTEGATQALEISLQQLNLNPEDEVWIITTTGNSYISGCVTRTIEKFCFWSREKGPKARAILVNHEFGFAYQNLFELKKYGLPIIEDAAYSMFSQNVEQSVGKVGDFVIYSLAKMFPVQAGGILVSNAATRLQLPKLMSKVENYFSAVLAKGLQNELEIIQKRRANFLLLAEKLALAGLASRFELTTQDVPGAFLFKAPGKDLPGLKEFMQRNGVECSVFYGEETFYIPCHQNMSENHIQYLVTLITYIFKP